MTSMTVRHSVSALVAVTYLLMVGVNVLANTLPLNGVRTGDVSEAIPTCSRRPDTPSPFGA